MYTLTPVSDKTCFFVENDPQVRNKTFVWEEQGDNFLCASMHLETPTDMEFKRKQAADSNIVIAETGDFRRCHDGPQRNGKGLL